MTATSDKCPACDGWGCRVEFGVFYYMNEACNTCKGTGRTTTSGSEPERSEGSLERVVLPQQRPKLKLREKYGWPVEFIKGRPITNIIRAILHTNIRMTWKHRNLPD